MTADQTSPGASAGRTFLVTGANSGIGRTLVDALAADGGAVVLAARSEERTRPVMQWLRDRHPSADCRFLQIDLSDFASVRRAAGEFLASGQRLDVLVNNAGVAGTTALNPGGYDLTYATNHLGPFLFTNLLLPRLTESPAARIVNVASAANFSVKAIDWSWLEPRPSAVRNGFGAYAATKLMNVLHAKALARRLEGTRVTTYSLHPGAVATEIWRALPRPLQWAIKLFTISEEAGARTSFYCATAPELAGASGRYYDKCRERAPNPLAERIDLMDELWRRSQKATE